MEEIEELRAKAIASMATPANPNSKLNTKPVETREEGELSSYEDDEVPTSSAAQSASTSTPPVEPNVVVRNKSTQNSGMGKFVSSVNGPVSSGDFQLKTSVKQNSNKHFEMDRVSSRSGNYYNPGWCKPPVADNNLVIRFSDDESESDYEEYKPERTSDRKENTSGVHGHKRPPASSHLNSEYLQRTANNQLKMMPKKVSLSRTFISSMTKINGANSRGPGSSLVGRMSQTRSSDPLNKASPGQEGGCSQGVSLNNSKLESLRRQIAIRENQLKLQLKSVQQSQETNSGSYHENNGMRPKNNAAGQRRPASVNTIKVSPYEQAKKRLKLEQPYHDRHNSDGQQQMLRPAPESVSKLKMISLENNGLNNENLVACNKATNGIYVGIADTITDRLQGEVDKQVSLLPKNLLAGVKDCESSASLVETISPTTPTFKLPNKQGTCSIPVAGITTNCSHSDKGTRLDDSSTVLNKNTQLAQMTSRVADGAASPLKMPSLKKSASPINTRLYNHLGDQNLLADNSMYVQTLMNMEEMQDKELDEAQEHRRRCEVEERNALKAYRKAQSALVEANTRCTYLFRRRELFSAQIQACIMEDSSSLWSSRCHKHTETGLNSLDNVPGTEVDQFPPSSHQIRAQFEGLNRLSSDKIQCKDVALLSPQHRGGLNVVSQPCTELDADEDEDAFTVDHKTIQSRLLCENEENFEKGVMDINEEPERNTPADNAQDCALLEASLRSELFARLGSKTVSNNSGLHCSAGSTVNKGVECFVENNKSQIGVSKQPLVGEEQNLISDSGGTDGPGKSICQLSIEVNNQSHGNMCSFDHLSRKIVDPANSSALPEACKSTAIVSSLPSLALRTAFNHVKNTPPVSSMGFRTRTQQNGMYSHEDGSGLGCYKLLGYLGARLSEDLIRGTDMQEMGSYMCDLSIDPFWPLCMYELRGKCNNEKCLWQHVKDFRKNAKQHDDSTRADFEVGTSLNLGGVREHSQFLHRNVMPAPPTYIVDSDLLGADLDTSRSVLARNIGQYWLNPFRNSFTVHFSAWENMLGDVPFLHVSDGRIEGQGSWNRKSLYLKSQDGAMKQLRQGLADPEQSLDLAIVLFSEEVNEPEGKKKALSVLSRALEADPTSIVLWMVYLHIYYRNEKAIGKDDMFLHAIQNNEGSYELWLMYINNRVHVDDRLVAYDTALVALCQCASACDRDKIHASACILDLFLQMMDFLSMSGNIGKAIQRIYGLFPTATGISDNSSMSLSNILSCLTVSDKGIFWVCCVYLVIYRKLPDAVVRQFEFGKEIPFLIEWPSVYLTADETCRALKLMEMGVDSVALDINCDSHERGNAPRSAHLLAVSHVQCVAVLEGLESSKNLLNKYIKLFPTCLELVLTLAHLNNKYTGDLGFEGFEEALRNWPKEVPGIQCIWNQYAQYALENRGVNFAEQLMVRWFQSFCRLPCPQTGKPDACFSDSESNDEMFGLLNLSLHKWLQKDQVEARLMIDKALKIAPHEDFKHCTREHAVFVLSNGSEPMEDSPPCGILSLLDNYLFDSRFSPVSEPLSRKFCQNIRKPRTWQLINSMLGSVSRDCSLINTVLEAWCGPSLLPEKFGDLKDLVDHVEALMEIFPANYRLALSVCELIMRSYCNSSGVASASVVFWASSLLVNSIYQVNPLAPEKAWVEVCGILSNLVVEVHGISESFHQQALSVYPFSLQLWKSYFELSKTTGNVSVVIDAAKKRGIKLD
ncbi:siRNA-mediated silencing protein NRDE-2 [Macleaya cordata]|uniref:SiRNA-mediated silencing protein NRDE-2 n=1 Tax=Macleaya cordata TaxID=56857 RepID=A0A200R6K5_MACCD|nr:siRNA-mediated silencing protein NRDE-2 [Macleaya cordata]